MELSAGEENSLRLLSDPAPRAMTRRPRRAAVVRAHRTVTFAELRRTGLPPGDRMAVALEDPASVLAPLPATTATAVVDVLAEPEPPGHAAARLLADDAPTCVIADASSSLAPNLPVRRPGPALPVVGAGPAGRPGHGPAVRLLHAPGSPGGPEVVVGRHAEVVCRVPGGDRRPRPFLPPGRRPHRLVSLAALIPSGFVRILHAPGSSGGPEVVVGRDAEVVCRVPGVDRRPRPFLPPGRRPHRLVSLAALIPSGFVRVLHAPGSSGGPEVVVGRDAEVVCRVPGVDRRPWLTPPGPGRLARSRPPHRLPRTAGCGAPCAGAVGLGHR
ncbi:hypothetical protein ABT288_22565 [Streptomyces sp. NPDC001093]|uniref:hypothetical protein n=1 Tax=Streptomyces sp. NPDC001093 TaxID=3154376 RepID=UPI0033314974